ncbi:flagellar operon protein [Thermincola ferriacetica]|uniref:Flagellar operon protein n=1 Tax=Thermincola ferriacetica TaxID=281456 RepID=A0A0L6W5S1_9FIRM|nr:TIGR02530 family flagellar biosynthesis protein [Thermincola ferriacetica]KNZ70880.1 flagellar operon protein [Thermincola ferriacetica]
MVDKLYFNQPILPVNPSHKKQQPDPRGRAEAPQSFQNILLQQMAKEPVKFSQHALQRLSTRNIQLSPADMQKLNDAVQRAAQKGARDSLVLMNNMAFIVSVTNRTVITAVDDASMKENVFTNIDSAVIV